MKKEKVIIFEGEQNFVIPKNRVRDKKTGISYYVPDEMNVTAPVGTPMDEPIEPPRQPDEPIGSPKTTTTQQEDASKPSPVPTDTTLASRGTLAQNDAISLGDRSSVMSDEKITNDVCLQYTVFDVSDSSTSSFSYIPCGSSTRSTVSISDGGDEVTICAKMNSIETITGRIEIQGGVACGGSNPPSPPPPPPPPPPPTPSPSPIPTLPIETIANQIRMGGGFGGGGGGSKDGASAPKKTFLQKYWWLLLIAAAGGYYYYKKKNK